MPHHQNDPFYEKAKEIEKYKKKEEHHKKEKPPHEGDKPPDKHEPHKIEKPHKAPHHDSYYANDPFFEKTDLKNDPFGEKAKEYKEKYPEEEIPDENHTPHPEENHQVKYQSAHYGNDPFYEKKSHEIVDPYKEKH